MRSPLRGLLFEQGRGESFPPVSCSERGDREAGSDVFGVQFITVVVAIVVLSQNAESRRQQHL